MSSSRTFARSVFLVCLLMISALCVIGCSASKTVDGGTEPDVQISNRTIVDAAGREVSVPIEVKKIYSCNPIGTQLVYTIDPQYLAGWNTEPNESEKKFIDEKYWNLPVLGGWYYKSTGNMEVLMSAKPDIIINLGTLDDATVEFVDGLQEQTGIPVVMMDRDLSKISDCYNLLGDIMDKRDETDVMASYCTDVLDEVAEKSALISDEEKIKVYYAEGAEGLNTEPTGSEHIQVLDMVGGLDVAEVEKGGVGGMSSVSLEQVLLWDPDVILAWNTTKQGGYYDGILTDPDWRNISAVKNDNVYSIPCEPYCWFERPPSVNRILGLEWTGNLLYPDIYEFDMKEKIKEFYSLFYHYELTDEEVSELLVNAQ